MQSNKVSRAASLVMAIALCASLPAFAKASGVAKSKQHKSHFRKGAWKHHGQQKIDSDRAREIQTALIREKYLEGEPSGVWDQKTKDAMTHFQDDHGWQTKSLPDARALIQLGLGPKHENVINPESLGPVPAAGQAQNSFTASGKPLK